MDLFVDRIVGMPMGTHLLSGHDGNRTNYPVPWLKEMCTKWESVCTGSTTIARILTLVQNAFAGSSMVGVAAPGALAGQLLTHAIIAVVL